MKYSLRQLDNVTTILSDIKILDADITTLDSLAQKVSENNIIYSLKVSGDLPSGSKDSVLTNDGSLKKDGDDVEDIYFRMFSLGSRTKSVKPDNTLLTFNLSDTNMLAMLGMLIGLKYEKREELKNQIRELGIEI